MQEDQKKHSVQYFFILSGSDRHISDKKLTVSIHAERKKEAHYHRIKIPRLGALEISVDAAQRNRDEHQKKQPNLIW